MKIHHIGYAVKDIEKSIIEFENIGFVKEGILYNDLSRKIYVQFLKNNNYRIELVCPSSEGSPIDNIIDKNGNIPYHICYETEDLNNLISRLLKEKYKLIRKPKNAVAIKDNKVAFLYKKDIGLIEIVEVRGIDIN